MLALQPNTCKHTCDMCGCFAGVISFITWIGPTKLIDKYLPEPIASLVDGISVAYERFFCAKMYLHQAKIRRESVKTLICNPMLLIMISNYCAHTTVNNHYPNKFHSIRKHNSIAFSEKLITCVEQNFCFWRSENFWYKKRLHAKFKSYNPPSSFRQKRLSSKCKLSL